MKHFIFAVVIFLFCSPLKSWALSDPITNDVQSLIQKVDPHLTVNITWEINLQENLSSVSCQNGQMTFSVRSSEEEASATLYYHLRKMGFLFPHPRMEIRPRPEQLISFCDSQVQWKPRLKNRGFHLHTQHPSEFLAGFMMGHSSISLDFIRWITRNQQNVLQIQLIQLKSDEADHLRQQIALARQWGIRTGLSVSFASIQQRSHKLISILGSLSLKASLKEITKNLKQLLDYYPMDFVSFELGTSEFTKTNPKHTIAWMNLAGEMLSARNMEMFVKIHASNNQKDKQYGNYNFLPQFANSNVGIEPHTVYFYGLNDQRTPFYHRQNFEDMKEFYLKEAPRRPAMYFPETSYFIFMDVDAPLYLTDYLSARTDDVDWMQDHQLDGMVNFSTGQELGYWLFDYQVALLADPDSRQNPYLALQLLGEDVPTWQKILQWQKKYFKDEQLIQMLFFSNMMDEISKPVHEQILLKSIRSKTAETEAQLALMKEALAKAPDLQNVRHPELKAMLQLTLLRAQHAFQVRTAALHFKKSPLLSTAALRQAANLRAEAQKHVNFLFQNYLRYPEVPGLTEKPWLNPSSYSYGYLATVKNLQLWEREELVIAKQNFSPFFKTWTNPLRILLGRSFFETLFPKSKYQMKIEGSLVLRQPANEKASPLEEEESEDILNERSVLLIPEFELL